MLRKQKFQYYYFKLKEKDTYVLPGGQNTFASYAKNCELVVIESAQHDMYRESDEILKPYLEKIFNFYKNT